MDYTITVSDEVEAALQKKAASDGITTVPSVQFGSDIIIYG